MQDWPEKRPNGSLRTGILKIPVKLQGLRRGVHKRIGGMTQEKVGRRIHRQLEQKFLDVKRGAVAGNDGEEVVNVLAEALEIGNLVSYKRGPHHGASGEPFLAVGGEDAPGSEYRKGGKKPRSINGPVGHIGAEDSLDIFGLVGQKDPSTKGFAVVRLSMALKKGREVLWEPELPQGGQGLEESINAEDRIPVLDGNGIAATNHVGAAKEDIFLDDVDLKPEYDEAKKQQVKVACESCAGVVEHSHKSWDQDRSHGPLRGDGLAEEKDICHSRRSRFGPDRSGERAVGW